MKRLVVSATEFKAKCLALLDDVDQRGAAITVTKRGRPVATIGPVRRRPLWKSSEGAWIGKVSIPAELLTADRSELWEVVHPK
jgi:prevent-host-death family protein